MIHDPTLTRRRILLVANDNTFTHVYPDLAGVLAEQEQGDRFAGAVEFFDPEGQRLVPFFGPDWRMVELHPSGDAPDPVAVQVRLRAVVQHVAAYLHAHPDLAERAGMTVDEAVATLPRVGNGTLAEDLDELPWHVQTNKGGFVHNTLHAAGWAH
ncbi:hypothetical protein ACI2K4_09980 [Micromonospora sp. NPDC050397]|uniref:hypothetical protein n=1 Tax=Micromonospora sp. NPDC050397 TaxID=3364279 RepID=UPI003850ACEA